MRNVAVIVGHSPTGDRGAVSVGGVAEYDFNLPVARMVCEALGRSGSGLKAHLIQRTRGIAGVVADVNALSAACAIELHFNSFSDPSARGTETLHWHTSGNSRRLALLVQRNVTSVLRLHDRGLKPIAPGGRGAGFLSGTNCPAVIAEPFFGSNTDDWRIGSRSADALAAAYASAIEAFVGGAKS